MNKAERLDSIRVIVDQMLLTIEDAFERRCAYLHLYGVSQMATQLAVKRGLNVEIASIIGMLHDYYTYVTGISYQHGINGAEAVRPIIRDLDMFSEEEQKTICQAIFHHSDKVAIHNIYDELIKDADILQHYLYDTARKVRVKSSVRLKRVLEELDLPVDFEIEDNSGDKAPAFDKEMINQTYVNRRELIGKMAKSLATANIVGRPSDSNYRAICRYWPDDNIYKTAKDNWCAMFVYHICYEQGVKLPIKFPGNQDRFGVCSAWKEWASNNEINCFNLATDKSFEPSLGDIILFDKLLTEHDNDHMGIVIEASGDEIIVAEGNLDNKNVSGICRRNRYKNVSGFIRIDDAYSF